MIHFSLAFSLIWAVALKDACYGPIYVSRNVECLENLDPKANKFQTELVAISAYLHVRTFDQDTLFKDILL